MGKQRPNYVPWVSEAPADDRYPYAYNLKLINGIEELTEVLKFETECIAFDTETTRIEC